MVTEGIVLRHKISATGLEVDQAKIAIIKTLMSPTTVKGIRSFLGHAGFYRRFIKVFSKISKPLCRLLEKDAKFDFDESCKYAFEEIKSRLVLAPIMLTPDWNNEFEIMCDASDYAMGAVLGRRNKKILKANTIPAKHSMRHKKTTPPQRRRCWQWCLLVKNSGLISNTPNYTLTVL